MTKVNGISGIGTKEFFLGAKICYQYSSGWITITCNTVICGSTENSSYFLYCSCVLYSFPPPFLSSFFPNIFLHLPFFFFLTLILPPTSHQQPPTNPPSRCIFLPLHRATSQQGCSTLRPALRCRPLSLLLFLSGLNPFLLSAMNDSLSNYPPVSGRHRPIAKHNGEKMAAVKRRVSVTRGRAVSCSIITVGA